MVNVRDSVPVNAILLSLLALSALLALSTHPRIAAATAIMAAGHVVAMIVRRRQRRGRL